MRMTDFIWVLALALRPLAALFLFGVVALGIKWVIVRYMPECWLKKQLLTERLHSTLSASNRKITGGRY